MKDQVDVDRLFQIPIYSRNSKKLLFSYLPSTYKGEILIEMPSDQIKNLAEDNYESVDEKIVLFLLRPGMYLGRNCNHTNLDMKVVQMYKYT